MGAVTERKVAMRVLHTSDWHIGRRFKGLDLGKYQARALDWLIGLIESERVDVLCVSGDIYDLPRPSAAAVQLFAPVFERLAGLTVNGHPLEVIMTPGNHDSADRLGFGAGAMVPKRAYALSAGRHRGAGDGGT